LALPTSTPPPQNIPLLDEMTILPKNSQLWMIEGYLTIRPAARKGYGSIAHEADRQLVGQTKAIIKLENAS